MRLAPLFALAVLVGAAGGGCSERWRSGPFARPSHAPEALSWSSVDPGSLDVREEPRRTVRYRLPLPPPAPGRPRDLREVTLRFRQPLDGAKVDARGTGQRQTLTLLDGKRVGGDTVTVRLAPTDLEQLEVIVHHHLRPQPLVEEVRLGRAAGDGHVARSDGR